MGHVGEIPANFIPAVEKGKTRMRIGLLAARLIISGRMWVFAMSNGKGPVAKGKQIGNADVDYTLCDNNRKFRVQQPAVIRAEWNNWRTMLAQGGEEERREAAFSLAANLLEEPEKDEKTIDLIERLIGLLVEYGAISELKRLAEKIEGDSRLKRELVDQILIVALEEAQKSKKEELDEALGTLVLRGVGYLLEGIAWVGEQVVIGFKKLFGIGDEEKEKINKALEELEQMNPDERKEKVKELKKTLEENMAVEDAIALLEKTAEAKAERESAGVAGKDQETNENRERALLLCELVLPQLEKADTDLEKLAKAVGEYGEEKGLV